MATLKINERALATLAPATNHARTCSGADDCKCALQSYVWDTDLTGFGVVVGRSGIKTFVARGTVRGKKLKRRVWIGVAGAPRPDGHVWTAALARIKAREYLGQMAAGIDPNQGKRATSTPAASTGPTMRQALEQHIANMRRKNRSERSIRTIDVEVRLHLAAWLDRPLVDFTTDELEAARDRIERETKPVARAVNPPGRVQANKLIAHVSAIWNAADRRWNIPLRNPARGVEKSTLEARTARINDGGFVDWYATVTAADMNPIRRDLQLTALFTAIRTDGVRHLRWEDIDDAQRLLHIRRAKGDKPYVIPLGATVREIFERRRVENAVTFAAHGGDQGWIFPSWSRFPPYGVIPVAEVKERRRDPIDRSRQVYVLPGIHASRRTYNSVAIELGIPPEPRLALLNHQGRGVNLRHYANVQAFDFIRECAERIEAALRERLGMPPIAAPTNARPMLRAV